ncbi:MAG TPA: hypothetical protein VK750_02370, partial [Cytophagaceae bacterium]|nr:hypothetical protein [Cytophagaceae bacterium]
MTNINITRLRWSLPAVCLLSICWMFGSLWELQHTIEEIHSPMAFNLQFNVAVCVFLLSTFLCFKLYIGLFKKNSNISALLWYVFYSATGTILVSLLIKSMLLYFLNSTFWTLKVWNLFE